jgi:Kdo2-lipid IVA lauroyltransferase/acyltransferase
MAYLSYLIFYGIGKLLARLPLRVLYVLSDFLYLIVFYIIRYRKNVVLNNLKNSFPEKSHKEIDEISRKFYRHFCDIFIEILKLMHMSPKEMGKRMKLRNPEVLYDEIKNRKHIMCVVSHHNNWEWGGTLVINNPYKMLSVYRPLTNKYFDEFMIRLRSQYGGEVVPMRKTARVMVEKMNSSDLYVYNFISDQSPYHSEIQYWTNFMNQETPVNLGAEKIARASKIPVYFAKLIKIKRGYYEAELIKVCDDASATAIHEVTDKHVAILESIIREAPEYYLWTHKRWKHKKPKA